MIELIIIGIILLFYFGYIGLSSTLILGGICLGGACSPGHCTEETLIKLLNELVSKGEFVELKNCDPLPIELKYAFDFYRVSDKCTENPCEGTNTCRHLEIDGWNKITKIAFEYDGPYHYTLRKFEDKSKDKPEDTIAERTKRKMDALYMAASQHGVKVIHMPYVIPPRYYRNYLASRLYDLGELKPRINFYYIPEVYHPRVTLYDDLAEYNRAKTPEDKQIVLNNAQYHINETKNMYKNAIEDYTYNKNIGNTNYIPNPEIFKPIPSSANWPSAN